MWLLTFLWWAGLLLQLGGIGIALWGLATNEDEYMPVGKRSMLRTVRELPRQVANGVTEAWRELSARVTGRRSVNIQVEGAGHVEITGVVAGSAHVAWEPIPEGATVEERLELAESRLRELRGVLDVAELNISEAATQHARLANEVTRQADELRRHADESVGKLATRGVRLAAAGLAITALGMLFSAFGASPLPW